MEIRKPAKGQLVVLAKCGTCGKVLMESNPLTKAQLIKYWDRTVIGALSIPCKDCGTKFPNFDINLVIKNKRTGREFQPTDYIKIPKKYRYDPTALFRSVYNQWKEEHPETPTAEEVVEDINAKQEEFKEISLSQRIEDVKTLRSNYVQGRPDGEDTDGVVQSD